MKRKIYQAPELNSYEEMCECMLSLGTTIPVNPGEEGSQSEAESKPTGDYFEEVDKSIRSYDMITHILTPRATNHAQVTDDDL